MKVRLATPTDSFALKDFFESTRQTGRVEVSIKRHTDFFDIYRIQSEKFKVYVIEDDHQQLHGMAALTFRRGYIDGHPQMIGFARDLRITKSRSALLKWSRHFLPVIEKEMQKNDCRCFFSAIGDGERAAYNTFVRPKLLRRKWPRYYLLRKLDLVTLHGHLPVTQPLETIRIEHAHEAQLEELADYLDAKSRQRPLGPVFADGGLAQTLRYWPGLSLQDFLVARDVQGRIIGCCAPWSLAALETLFVHRYQGLAANLRKVLTWGSHLGLTRRLARPSEPLLVSFLTHLFADNPDIFYALLLRAWRETDAKQSLVYSHFYGEPMTLPPPSFIHTKMPYAMYTILPPHQQLPGHLRPRLQSPPPYFEFALL